MISSPMHFSVRASCFQFNRLTLVRVVAGITLCLVFWLGARSVKLMPGRGQVLLEMAAEFVRNGISVAMLGEGRGRRWAAFIGVVFFGVLFMNIQGIIPGNEYRSFLCDGCTDCFRRHRLRLIRGCWN